MPHDPKPFHVAIPACCISEAGFKACGVVGGSQGPHGRTPDRHYIGGQLVALNYAGKMWAPLIDDEDAAAPGAVAVVKELLEASAWRTHSLSKEEQEAKAKAQALLGRLK